MIGAGKGGRVVARPGGGHGRMNKTIPCGWGSLMEVFFYVGSLFSPRRGHFFRMLWGVFLVCPPPLNFFCWNPYNCYHIFFTSQIFIFLPDRGGLNFLGNFSFLEGVGLREGGRLFSPFRLFFSGSMQDRGGGYRIMIVK